MPKEQQFLQLNEGTVIGRRTGGRARALLQHSLPLAAAVLEEGMFNRHCGQSVKKGKKDEVKSQAD